MADIVRDFKAAAHTQATRDFKVANLRAALDTLSVHVYNATYNSSTRANARNRGTPANSANAGAIALYDRVMAQRQVVEILITEHYALAQKLLAMLNTFDSKTQWLHDRQVQLEIAQADPIAQTRDELIVVESQYKTLVDQMFEMHALYDAIITHVYHWLMLEQLVGRLRPQLTSSTLSMEQKSDALQHLIEKYVKYAQSARLSV